MKKNDYLWISVIGLCAVAFFASAFWPRDKQLPKYFSYEKIEASNNSRLYDEALTDACLVEAYLYSVPKSENGFAEMTNALHQQKEAFFSALPNLKLSPNQMVALMLAHSQLGTKAFKERIGCTDCPEDLAIRLFYQPLDETCDAKAFWILYHIYYGAIPPLELYDYPIQSYIKLPEDVLYQDGSPVWFEGLDKALSVGETPTLRDLDFIPNY